MKKMKKSMTSRDYLSFLRKKMMKLEEAWPLSLILVMKEEELLETNKN
jgi:ATP sulfurylase